LRALVVFSATGRSLLSFQGTRTTPPLDPQQCLCLFITRPRLELQAAIDTRFDAMLASGALNEVDALRERKLDPTLPLMRAHGVPHLIAHLDGRMSLEEAASLAKRDTRAYVKRQFTFARHQLPEFAWTLPHQINLELSPLITPQASARVRSNP
jgi:tRNA dimethylallyltransferase